MLEPSRVSNITSLLGDNVTAESAEAGNSFTRCLDAAELNASVALHFELNSLFLLTGVDTRGSSDGVAGVRLEYGLTSDTLSTYRDERLGTDVRRKLIACTSVFVKCSSAASAHVHVGTTWGYFQQLKVHDVSTTSVSVTKLTLCLGFTNCQISLLRVSTSPARSSHTNQCDGMVWRQ